MSCDWCEGGACDLVIGDNITAEVFADSGMLVVYDRGKKIASRHVKYCPMCGKRIGIPTILEVPDESFFLAFKNCLKRLFRVISVDERILNLMVSTNGWNEALERTCEVLNMKDWYKIYRGLDWVDREYYDKMLVEKIRD